MAHARLTKGMSGRVLIFEWEGDDASDAEGDSMSRAASRQAARRVFAALVIFALAALGLSCNTTQVDEPPTRSTAQEIRNGTLINSPREIFNLAAG